ncbi:hypothetical protein QM467_04425 [Rhodoblastus sp. 17X3]|uniref:hypothetical protein n=1 Tax=Rhodoblastus sp. 17X3 TaxID=3047026 RepID=UPI0024B7DC65|nr:hypothetical protein [Rhodoblastus sp. 17X3]MDI9847306.1 hypothetical protein [Rhodoblastus sp. 17X3]
MALFARIAVLVIRPGLKVGVAVAVDLVEREDQRLDGVGYQRPHGWREAAESREI